MGNTLIQVSDELWEKLNSMKDRKTKTFEMVIHKLIKMEETENEHKKDN